MSKKVQGNRILILLVFLSLLGIISLGIYGIFSSGPMKFNSWLWKECFDRDRMVEDLMERQILDGMTKEDVTNLLGEGQPHKPTDDKYAEEGYSVRYYTSDPETWPNAVFVVIYNLDDVCIGCTTDPTCPY